MKTVCVRYMAIFAALLLATSEVLRAEPYVEESLNVIRRLEGEYTAHKSDERLEAWRNAIADFEKSHLRNLDIALLKARFHYYGEQNACAAVNALKPYMHYASSRPEIPYFIWTIMGDMPHGSLALQPSLNEMTKDDERLFQTLRSYWASFIPEDFKMNEKDAADIAECSGGCSREEGLRAWRKFLDILEKAESSRMEREERLAAEKRMKATSKPVSPTVTPSTGKTVGTSGGKGVHVKIAAEE
ncbi:MAG: hypothetical protein IJS15_04035 [Victivallales bacterium]|nr:hypothetical protein [Victivallales bacterium]